MILLQRYLRTLQLFLPKAQREDIIRELSEEIETEIAEQERDIGRSLSAEEEAAIIGKYGHPLLAAARYRRQQYLIGPLLFPYYWLLLRVVLVLILVGHVIGSAIFLANGAGWSQVGDLAERLVQTSLMVFGWLTLLAAVADLWITRSRVLEKWNPRTLVFRSRARSSAPATTNRHSALGIALHCSSGSRRLVAAGAEVSDSPLRRWRRHRGVGACDEPNLPRSRPLADHGAGESVRWIVASTREAALTDHSSRPGREQPWPCSFSWRHPTINGLSGARRHNRTHESSIL